MSRAAPPLSVPLPPSMAQSDFIDLTLDPDSAHESWLLSEDRRTATLQESRQTSRPVSRPVPRPYPGMVQEEESWPLGEPNGQGRFIHKEMVLGSAGLTGRRYFEVERKGAVDIAMTYRRSLARMDRYDLGDNRISWNLRIYSGQYFVCSRNVQEPVRDVSGGRVGVYLDHEAGRLSFYEVIDGREPSHLHTFTEAFTEPLWPAFGVWVCTRQTGASVAFVRPVGGADTPPLPPLRQDA